MERADESESPSREVVTPAPPADGGHGRTTAARRAQRKREDQARREEADLQAEHLIRDVVDATSTVRAALSEVARRVVDALRVEQWTSSFCVQPIARSAFRFGFPCGQGQRRSAEGGDSPPPEPMTRIRTVRLATSRLSGVPSGGMVGQISVFL